MKALQSLLNVLMPSETATFLECRRSDAFQALAQTQPHYKKRIPRFTKFPLSMLQLLGSVGAYPVHIFPRRVQFQVFFSAEVDFEKKNLKFLDL